MENRIAAPLYGVARTAILTDPRLAPFVQVISPATSAQDLALINALLPTRRPPLSSGGSRPPGLKVHAFELLVAYATEAWAAV